MDSLQCLRPTHQPRVTDHIEQIQDMITQIINNEFAYDVEGDVFFAVEKYPNYGQSGQKLENNRAGERVAVDSRKRNAADFALWKAAKPGEPSWESPWGPGRPGWHIECSAMSAHYLSFKFDIHGGGSDLAFPHHENEITQSAAACQESNVSYWMHNGHVTNNNEKMSKSLGNFFTIRQDAKWNLCLLRTDWRMLLGSVRPLPAGPYRSSMLFCQAPLDDFASSNNGLNDQAENEDHEDEDEDDE